MPTSIVKSKDRTINKYKLKKYKKFDIVQSIRCEMEYLNNNGYTHVANMPGKLSEIFYYAKYFQIVPLDNRIVKHIADTCSKINCKIISDESL